LAIVVAVLAVAVLGLVFRLVDLQLLHHEQYREQAQEEHLSRLDIMPRRGAILDRNGYPLAASVDAYDVLVDKHIWGSPDKAHQSAETLADVLIRPTDDILADLDGSISREVRAFSIGFIPIKWQQAISIESIPSEEAQYLLFR